MDAATASKLEKVARRHAGKAKALPYQKPQRMQQLKPPQMYQPQLQMYQPQMLPQQPQMQYYGQQPTPSQQLAPSQQFAASQQFVPGQQLAWSQQYAPGPQGLRPQPAGQFPPIQPQQLVSSVSKFP